jgi:hypothetical protein
VTSRAKVFWMWVLSVANLMVRNYCEPQRLVALYLLCDTICGASLDSLLNHAHEITFTGFDKVGDDWLLAMLRCSSIAAFQLLRCEHEVLLAACTSVLFLSNFP